jgi:photosystem II stability/assembly factor-like uncharacterized protein
MSKIRKTTLIILLGLVFCFSINADLYAQGSKWQRTNIGGGGAMNFATASSTGTIVVATDLGGAYIKRKSNQYWQIIGAASGMHSTHVISAAFHPSNPNIIFLATDGGIYRSTDEGNHFNLVEGGDHRVFHFIAVSPSNPSIVYASVTPRYNRLTDINGFLTPVVMRSNDGGLNFEYVARPQDSDNILFDEKIVGTKLIVPPNKPDWIILLSTDTRFIDISSSNVYLSTNGGLTWNKIADHYEPTDFIFHPNTPHYAFLAYKDSGQGTAGVTVSDNVINNVWHDVFDTGFFPTGNNPHLLLWPQKNINNPTSLRAVNIYTSWYHDLPRQAAWRIKNTTNTIDTADGWEVEELGNVEQWAGSADNWHLGWSKIHSILNPGMASRATTIGFDLSDSNKLFWVTNQFVFSFRDDIIGSESLTVENLTTKGSEALGWQSTGLDNITPFILEINQSDSNVIYAGLNDLGCAVSQDAGAHWKLCIHDTEKWPGIDGHSYGGVVTALASDPHAPERVWMFAAGDQNQPAIPYFSNDFGEIWIPGDTTGLIPTHHTYGLSVDPTSPINQRRLFVTINGNVYRSHNHGQSWSLVFNCNQGCRVTEINPSNGFVYAGGEQGLFVSKANGDSDTWETVLTKNRIDGFNHGNVFHRGAWGGVSAIEVDNNNPGIIFVAVFQDDTNQGVYRCHISTNIISNQGCVRILDNAAFLRDVAIDPVDSNIIYASSSSAYTSGGFNPNSGGIYRTSDGGMNWTQINEGLEWPMVIPIAIKPDNPSRVLVGSPGGGYYWRNFNASTIDTDNDGITDDIDNCIQTPNPDQRDSNNDGYGNLCDADLDNNGTVSFADLRLFRSAFATNNQDADFDGNGSVSFGDLAIFKASFGKPPGPAAISNK